MIKELRNLNHNVGLHFNLKDWSRVMTIRHLEIFVAVADCGKMSLAAERLFISQPSVSQAIGDIESYYGVKLFERLSKKLYITEDGEKLLKYARHIVSAFNDMDKDMKNSNQEVILKIGGTVTVGTCILCPLIRIFERKNPGVSTKVTINNTSEIEEMLINSSLDIAIIEGEILNKDIIKVPVYQDELVLVCGAHHPFAKMDKINLEQLNDQDFIAREQGSRDRNIFEQSLKEKGISVNVKWTSTNTEAIKNAVVAGQGIAVLSSTIIIKEIYQGTIKVIPIDEIKIKRDICMVYHKDKFISETMKKFMEVCTTYKMGIIKSCKPKSQ